jgi:mycothiol synthase
VTKREGSGAGEVYLLAVDPDSAGMGYGSMLASAGYEWLAGRGATTAVVWVDEDNEKARGVYRRLGLVEDFRSREMTPATG